MKTNKMLYGLLAFTPLIMIAIIFVFMGMMIYEMISNPDAMLYREPEDLPYYGEMMIASTVAGVVGLIGLVMYVMHCLNNTYIPEDKRIIWIVLLVFLNTIGMMVYYFKWIAKEPEVDKQKPFGF